MVRRVLCSTCSLARRGAATFACSVSLQEIRFNSILATRVRKARETELIFSLFLPTLTVEMENYHTTIQYLSYLLLHSYTY